MKKKVEQETGGALGGNKKQGDLNQDIFTFMPPKAKPVPDFKRLQKTF